MFLNLIFKKITSFLIFSISIWVLLYSCKKELQDNSKIETSSFKHQGNLGIQICIEKGEDNKLYAYLKIMVKEDEIDRTELYPLSAIEEKDGERTDSLREKYFSEKSINNNGHHLAVKTFYSELLKNPLSFDEFEKNGISFSNKYGIESFDKNNTGLFFIGANYNYEEIVSMHHDKMQEI